MHRFLPFVLLVACASGVAGSDSGTPRDTGNRDTPFTDGQVRSDSMFGTDTGGGTCTDDTHADECTGSLVTTLRAGDAPVVIEGVLPTLSDSDWFTIEIPPDSMTTMQGVGTASLVLDGDATTVMEIRDSCDATLPLACGEGVSTAREITEYTFVDDQGMPDEPGAESYSTRDVPWPSFLVVRVGRRGGPATCMPYTLTVSR